MTHEPIHYVPVIEQRYAQIIQELEQHPARNQWSRKDRRQLSANLKVLASSGVQAVPGDTVIAMAVDLLRDVAGWIVDAPGLLTGGPD